MLALRRHAGMNIRDAKHLRDALRYRRRIAGKQRNQPARCLQFSDHPRRLRANFIAKAKQRQPAGFVTQCNHRITAADEGAG